MITDSSSFTKNQVASRPDPAETTGPDLSDGVIDPNEKHLGTDHLLSDLKGRTISGAFITIVAQGAQFLLSVVFQIHITGESLTTG